MSGENKDGGQGAPQELMVKVGDEERSFTPEQVAEMAQKTAQLEGEFGQLAGFKKVLEQYGVGAEDYIHNAESSFMVINQLIESGLIDEKGNVLEKAAKEPDKGKGKDDAGTFNTNLNSGNASKEVALLQKTLEQLNSRLDMLEEGQSTIYRRNIERDVQGKFPNLEAEDVTKVLAKAKADRSKSFWEHAEGFSKEKGTVSKNLEAAAARRTVEVLQKAGIISKNALDLETLDLDKLAAEEGKTAKPWEGQSFVFSSRRKKLKGAGVDVSKLGDPTKAMRDLTSNRFRGE